MRFTKTIVLAALTSAALAGCGGQQSTSRDQIKAVGSSTVYPFAKAAAEEFSRAFANQYKSPIVESTGTGGGMKLFCAGVGTQHPDIANASRRMKASEFETCQQNGVTEIVEIEVGKDGIAIAESKEGPTFGLTVKQVYEALAKEPYGKPNTAKNWSDIDPSLPNEPILVYGPPSTSGTRDALAELILTEGCKTDAATKALKETDEDRYEQICTEVRTDGAYVEQGENDNLIVQKLASNPAAIGVFGYSFLEENADKLRGLAVNGVEPTYDNITSNAYPGARSLYIYVKKQHLDAIPGLREYISTWVENWGKGGLFASKGMITSTDAVQAANSAAVKNMTVLDASVLK
ncbi:phosphate ABC transporter substrate-binding protein [Croceicoccus ponticola]|uniref:Phosphate ABC transporter substrate-binding protein n=1 Tax=Croceicoccus ponticola TaxID=2217664 RepID=A0A437H0T0_9SPHN|nr:substrate-binding domain-containing protein [Croceicoccus ponticola]RVQ69247.1 phosphate ABC transporter substrate-binding protein [Croceicoccus ponticola]